MPRVAFFLPHFEVGGAELVVLRLLCGLDRRLFQPALILQHRRGALLDQLPEDVDLFDLGDVRASQAVLPLARLLRRQRFDLCYTATNATNLLMLAALRLAGGISPALVSEHTPLSGFLAHAKARALRVAAMRFLYPRAAVLAAPLPQIGDEHRTLIGARTPPFHVLPNPVIPELPAEMPPLRDRARHLVSLGRLAPEKRFDLMIAAFAIAHARQPDLRLTIHGEGAARPALTAQIGELGLSDVISLPGLTRDVPAALSGADMFLCTSRLEGLGNAIIEAMAAGLPVISVDCPFGPAHLLQGGRGGALLADHSADAIASDITALSDDPPLRAAYRQMGRAMAARYTIDAAVAAHETCFTSCLRPARSVASE